MKHLLAAIAVILASSCAPHAARKSVSYDEVMEFANIHHYAAYPRVPLKERR